MGNGEIFVPVIPEPECAFNQPPFPALLNPFGSFPSSFPPAQPVPKFNKRAAELMDELHLISFN